MIGLAEISGGTAKKRPRGRPFTKGVSGNPGGRPKRTEEELDLAQACRAKTREALEVIESLMAESVNERVRLAAAQYLIDRGWGRATERVEHAGEPVALAVLGVDLTPEQAYAKIIHGEPFEVPDSPPERLSSADSGDKRSPNDPRH